MKTREDRSGNIIGDGSWSVESTIFDFNEYPQIQSETSHSETTETVYVTYINKDNNKRITVRFSLHENNAVKFGDQLDGNFASKNEILYHLGLKKRTFIPNTRPYIHTQMVAKKKLGDYEEFDLTIKEIYELGVGADLSNYKGKIAKGSNYLILSDRVELCEEKKRNMLGQEVYIGKYVYNNA